MGRIIAPSNFLLDNLIAFWNLDNGNDLSIIPPDYGSYSLNAYSNQYSSVAGKIENGFYFDGGNSEDYGLWTNTQLWNLLTNPISFSVSFWVKKVQNIDSSILGSAFGSMGFNFDYIYDSEYWAPNVGFAFRITKGLYDWNSAWTQENNIIPNEWYHIVGTYNHPSATMKLYVNNILKSTVTNVSIGANSEPNWHGFAVNGTVIDGGKVYGSQATFDAIGLWTKTLNENEISILYNNGNGRQLNSNKISIKKQNLGGGKINLNLYTANDPDARNYISAVEAADGQPLEPQVKIAINNFILGCKSDNIWTAIKASCLLAGAKTLNGALVSLVGTAPTNFNFIPADYDRKTGLLGDGSTKYLSSNRDNNADPQDNKHLSVYCTSGQTRNTTRYLIGSIAGVGRSFIATTANTLAARINYGAIPANISTTALLTNLIGVTRPDPAGTNTILEGSIIPTLNISTAPFTGNITIFTRADLQFYSNARIAFYSIGENIDLQKLDNRVRAYVNAISSI